ncbi:MAG: PD-(D/E)XK nuclease family protein [Cyanobacteria bacterium J06621_8]
MGKFWNYYVSYSIWSQISPAIGKERLHCDRRRGYLRAKKKEPLVKDLVTQDNIPQRIGILAQKGVYEFHQNIQLLSAADGVKKVAQILNLSQEVSEVRKRVELILQNYWQQPILLERNIKELSRGDESFPEPIPIKHGSFTFALFAAFDCVLLEPDNTIHILDFKTGKSNFDLRQAYVYLVAAQHLYPNQKAIASFYNLETQLASEPITLSPQAIESTCIELSLVAQKLQQDLRRYKTNPKLFNRIFPANPGFSCQYCVFNSVCEYVAF